MQPAKTAKGMFQIVLSPSDQKKILPLAIYPNKYSHHVTCAFKAYEDHPYWKTQLGKEVTVVGTRLYDDGSATALSISIGAPGNISAEESEMSSHIENHHPHVTLSCMPGTSPVHSNSMIGHAVTEKVSIHYMKGVVIFKPF